MDCGFLSVKDTSLGNQIKRKRLSLYTTAVIGSMITPEEYNRDKEDDEELEKLPTTAVVIIIVLASLVGVFIICEAIFGR